MTPEPAIAGYLITDVDLKGYRENWLTFAEFETRARTRPIPASPSEQEIRAQSIRNALIQPNGKPACVGHYNERDGKCVRCYQWMLECDEAPVEEGESREGA